MTVSTIFTLMIYAAVFWAFVPWAFSTVMSRISPKYAAKYRLKQQVKLDRDRDKRQKREAARTARLLAWAKAHPDDPAAKAILTEEASPSSSTTSSVDEEPDALAMLRQSQKEADDYERRREARKVAEQLRSQQMLQWALANPTSPEGRRHLEETLFEANQRVVSADQSIAIARYGVRDEGPEAIEFATRVAELEARKASDERAIADIQVALSGLLSDAE